MSEETEVSKFVERYTWTAKSGAWRELPELLVKASEQFPVPHGRRLYICTFGGSNWAIALEIEWESWDEYARVREEWHAKPEWGAFVEKMNELTVAGHTSRELWDLKLAE